MIIGRRAYRRHLPHYQSDFRTYFVTFVTRDRRELPPLARDLVLRHMLFDRDRRIALHTGIVMPDHVHMLLTPLSRPDGWSHSLPTILQGIKGSSARAINDAFGMTGPVWQGESFDHELRRDEDLRRLGEYIAQNPVRKGLCTTPEEYPWLWREWIDGDTQR